jgi:uncharacterized protein (TIGR00369 family)
MNENPMDEFAPDRSHASGRSSTSGEPSDTGQSSTAGGSSSRADGAGADSGAKAVADARPAKRPESMDGVSAFIGMRWEDAQTIRLRVRPELINAGGLLSGVATYALVDYCMGSTLWVQTTADERIATIGISINYVQTATEGEIVCRTELDRRNRSNAVMRSEVRHEDGRLLATAIGSYAIFRPRRPHAPPV